MSWEVGLARLFDGGYNLKPGDSRVIRRQHCIECSRLGIDTILAVTIENEAWWLKNGIWRKERWYGNHTKCPVCRTEGKLPMDKPLAYESGKIMQEVLR